MRIYVLSTTDYENFENIIEVFKNIEDAQKTMKSEFESLKDEYEVDECCCAFGETYSSIQFDGIWTEWDIQSFEV